MKEKVMDFINKLKDFWQGKNRRQKIILLSSIAAVIIVLSALIFLRPERQWFRYIQT